MRFSNLTRRIITANSLSSWLNGDAQGASKSIPVRSQQPFSLNYIYLNGEEVGREKS